MDVMALLLYLLTGIIAGLLAGLLGIGGGIIVVPILAVLFQQAHFPPPLIMQTAIGTSLAIMIFTSSSSAMAYYRRDLILWPLFLKFTPGMLIGTFLGARIAKQFSSEGLTTAFGCLMIMIAFQMVLNRSPSPSRELPHFLPLSLMGICVGILSSFFGIGGGTLMVPYFFYCSGKIHKAAGTSALCSLPLALFGTLNLILIGWETAIIHHAPSGTTGFVYWPAVASVASTTLLFAPLGTRLAVYLSNAMLKRLFAILLIFTGIYLLTRGLSM